MTGAILAASAVRCWPAPPVARAGHQPSLPALPPASPRHRAPCPCCHLAATVLTASAGAKPVTCAPVGDITHGPMRGRLLPPPRGAVSMMEGSALHQETCHRGARRFSWSPLPRSAARATKWWRRRGAAVAAGHGPFAEVAPEAGGWRRKEKSDAAQRGEQGMLGRMTGAAAAEVLVSETSLTQDEAARARQLKIARTRDGGVHTGQRESQYAETATLHACLGYRNGSRTQQRSKQELARTCNRADN